MQFETIFSIKYPKNTDTPINTPFLTEICIFLAVIQYTNNNVKNNVFSFILPPRYTKFNAILNATIATIIYIAGDTNVITAINIFFLTLRALIAQYQPYKIGIITMHLIFASKGAKIRTDKQISKNNCFNICSPNYSFVTMTQ